MDRRVVTVFGGSGFIGRHLVRRLLADGAIVRVVARDLEAIRYLATMGEIGRLVPICGDVADDACVEDAVNGADWVVNLVGILSPWGRQTFDRLHAEGAERVARAAQAAGAKRLVHLSAIGADPDAAADYARTKGLGEAAVTGEFPTATILRPSVVFGPEDKLFNTFAGLATLSPVLPVLGCPLIPKVTFFKDGLVNIDFFGAGGPRFQPVYVGDVADAAMQALKSDVAPGKTYELGGPNTYSFKEIMELVMAQTGRDCFLMPLALPVAKIKAFFLEWLPNPMITRDQVTMLETDNVVGPAALGLADLGVEPTIAEAILPIYLARFKAPVRQKRAAG